MHTDIQRFPNIQYYGGLLRSGLKSEPTKISRVPWPAIRNDASKEGKEISEEGDGAFVADGQPTHRMIFVHCYGTEESGNSPTNPMQVEAVEYVVDRAADLNPSSTQILVLSPYRTQVDLLTNRLKRSEKENTTVSTVDAAQGQEADLVVISFVRANSSGKLGFTDDARRLNVAISRAKARVVINGHLATSLGALAALSSGFITLLRDLKQQGGIYEYKALGSKERMRCMSNKGYDKIQEITPVAVQKPKRRQDNANQPKIPRPPRQQEDPEVLRRKIEDTAEDTRRHLIDLVKSPSSQRWRMSALSHREWIGQLVRPQVMSSNGTGRHGHMRTTSRQSASLLIRATTSCRSSCSPSATLWAWKPCLRHVHAQQTC